MIRDNCAPDEAELQGRSNVIRFPEQLVANLRGVRNVRFPQRAQRFRFPSGPNAWSSAEEWREFAVSQWLSRRVMASIDWDTAAVYGDSIDGDDDLPESAPERPNRYPFHEATNIYPMMSGQRLKDFAADIKAKGLLNRIVRCENRDGQWAILDGRARYDICLELGIEPKFEDYVGNPEVYLVSANLMRRDLSDLQRNLIAARTVNSQQGGVRVPSMISMGHKPAKSGFGGERTIDEAAAIYRLNPAGVERARAILDRGLPQFIAHIDSHDGRWVPVTRAYDIVTLTNVEKLDGLTSEEKQRQWLKNTKLFKRAKKPPLSPLESLVRKWRYLSPEDQRRFAMDFALPWLIAQARLGGATEIAFPDATIILTKEGSDL